MYLNVSFTTKYVVRQCISYHSIKLVSQKYHECKGHKQQALYWILWLFIYNTIWNLINSVLDIDTVRYTASKVLKVKAEWRIYASVN